MEMKLFSQQLLYSAPQENEVSQKAKDRLIEVINGVTNEVPTLDNIHAFLEVGDNLGSSHQEIRKSLAEYLKNCGVIDDLLAQVYFFACRGGWGWTLEEMREMGLQKVYDSLVVKEHNLTDEPMRKQWIVKAIECMQRFKFLINSAGSELS